MSAQRQTRSVTLDGRAVGYDEAAAGGEAAAGSGAPLVLLHGFTGGRDDFAAVLDPLAAHRRVLAPDFPGHGDSEGGADEASYSLGNLAAWVLRLADALGLGEFHLLGHSMGGLVAQRVAAAASQRLRSLVLADTGLGALREEAAWRVVRIALAARDEGPEAALAAARDTGQEGPADADEQALRRFRRLAPAAVVGGARNLVNAEPVGAFLRGIDIPVLVVHGEDSSHWSPREQHLLASTVAGAQRVAIPGTGHCPQRERPDAWLAAVDGFLRRAEM